MWALCGVWRRGINGIQDFCKMGEEWIKMYVIGV
jgi:hypothetical protein